jgi:hypothetical protein
MHLSFPGQRTCHLTRKHLVDSKVPVENGNDGMPSKLAKKRKHKNMSTDSGQKAKPLILCPESDGCARASTSGWEWRNWARNATPSERTRVRGYRVRSILSTSANSMWKNPQVKGTSARTNRVKLRNLLAASEGAELLKITQSKVNYFFACTQASLAMKLNGHSLPWHIGKEEAFTFSKEQDP